MRIDLACSILPKGNNELDLAKEELNLRNELSKLFYTKGYQKYYIAGSELISDDIIRKLKIKMHQEEVELFKEGDVVVFEGGFTNTVGLTMSFEEVKKYYKNGQIVGIYPKETMVSLKKDKS